ncbi:MAG: hypothetical protein V1779_07260 [bacterium]
MKLSKHFIEYSSKLRDYLSLELCEYAVNNYVKKKIQNNGRTRYWAYISKYNKYLRVVVDNDNETVLTAFFDRNFLPEKED